MSSNNPSITASDIVTDIEARLLTPNVSTTTYLPWISHAYAKTHQALAGASHRVKEELFGDDVTIDLTPGTSEYSLSTHIPRYGGIIKVEIRYGLSGDDWNRAEKLKSVAHWRIQNNVSTNYRSKINPLYYILSDTIGFIPTPTAGEVDQTAQAKVWYFKRSYQITAGTDVIDIPYRFIYPITNYVLAKTIQRENEDFLVAQSIERQFEKELEDIAVAAVSEFGEQEGVDSIEIDSSHTYNNPLHF